MSFVRRLIAHASSGLGPHSTTPLRKNAAVHHSKNCALMSQMGQSRRIGAFAMLPGMSAMPSIATEPMSRNETSVCATTQFIRDHMNPWIAG